MKQTRNDARNPAATAIWNAIKGRGSFTRADLAEETGYSDSVVGEQIRRLKARGEIEVLRREAGREIMGVKPAIPTVQPSSTDLRPEAALWDAMRTLRRFSPTDLQLALSIARPDIELSAVRKYCQQLTRAKYLRVVAKATVAEEARYFLRQDTGPKAPHIKRLGVLVDPNEEAVTWTPEVPA